MAQECNTLRPGCVVALSDLTIVAGVASTHVVGSGTGGWACLVYPDGSYRDSLGRNIANDTGTPWWRNPEAMGPDHAVCLRPHSNAFADVLEANDEVWRLADADIANVQLLGARRAIYSRGFELHTLGITLEHLPIGEWGWPRAIAANDGFKLLYQSYTGECLVFDGRVIAEGRNFFRPDAIVLGDTLHVAWSTQEQEVGATPDPLVIPIAALSSLPRIEDRLAVTPPPTPIDPPKPTPEPPPMNLIAPNLIELIRQTMREHPEINKLDENQRGRILDYAAAKAGPSWGRKSRNAQGTDLNSDAFCFLRSDGLFEIYDVISGGDGSATWDGYGPYKQGENGYWVKALPVTDTPPTPQPPPTPSVDVVTRAQMDTAIHAAIMDLHQALLNEVDHSVGDRIADLKEELRHQPVETDQLVELLKRVTVTGKTRTSFGHQHQVDLGLTLKP